MSIETTAMTNQQPEFNSEPNNTILPSPNPDGAIKPHPQNRKVVIMAWLTTMPDGKTRRVEQVFDAPVAFSIHHDLINTLNDWRTRTFGEDARLYETKNLEMPDENTTVYCLIANTKSGKIINEKVFNGAEAAAYLAKSRAELESNRAKARRQFGDTSSDGFHTLRDAIDTAAEEKRTEIVVNN